MGRNVSSNGARPNLRVVQAETGEIHECESCTELTHTIAGLESTVRSQAAMISKLRMDRERTAREHPRWGQAEEIFAYWQRHCHHPRSKFNAERFWIVLPFLESDGPDLCRRAIDGAAFDPFTVKRRNGSTKRFDDWELIFGRSRGKTEEFCNRAPRGTA